MNAVRLMRIFLGVVLLAAPAIWLGLPKALNAMGLHPDYEIPHMDLSGHRALIVTTSVDRLAPTNQKTGVASSEMTIPYYAFRDAGMDVELASIEGGQIPIEPGTLRWPVATRSDRRFGKDSKAQQSATSSIPIGDIDVTNYSIVFLAGGWGAAYDFAQSETLGRKVSEAYDSGAVIGGVCHGVLGLLPAQTSNGDSLVSGRRLTGVTNKQIEEIGISFTPMHPERDLRAAGAVFEAEVAFRDFFASHVVVDGRLVTGQNQNSGAETAHRMMETVLSTHAN